MSKLSKVARWLNLRNGQSSLPPILLLTDDHRLPDPTSVIDQLPAGSGVILRHYGCPDRNELAHDLAIYCRKLALKFFVANDVALAMACNADGLHLPAWQVGTGRKAVRLWKRRPDRLVTAAAHSELEARRAAAIDVDAVLLSPIFTTASHSDGSPIGPKRLMSIDRKTQLPNYALGGLNENNVSELLSSGIVGIAGISGLAEK